MTARNFLIMTAYLDSDLMEKICHPLAVAFFNAGGEPIPSFTLHSKQLLDASLNNPRQTFDGHELYSTIIDKACILFYSLIQNHPFPNGNKRIATASLLVFLYINDHWLEASNEELAAWAIKLADIGSIQEKKEWILSDLKIWISDHLQRRAVD